MNILLTSAGRRTYMIRYFKNALKGTGLVHASNSVFTYTLSQADKYVITPQIYDEGYVDFLLVYCRKENISVIISLFDIDLPILAENKKKFAENGIKVVVSDYDVTQICNDKWLTYKFLGSVGLPRIPTFIRLDDVTHSLKKGYITFPLILKPRWGMGSIGIYTVNNENELDVLYKKLHQEIFDTYLKYESKVDVDSCIVIQKKIVGQEYGMEILNDLLGYHVATFVKKKLAMRSGETDIAETVSNSDFNFTANAIANGLRHIAMLDADCFKLADGRIYVLELNCRFGGQYPFTHNAGVDVPLQIVKWLNGENTDLNLLSPMLGVRSCKDIMPIVF